MLRIWKMATETVAKRARLSGPPVIGTHNGHFHADEALAVYMLRMLPAYKQSSLIRTRDPELLAECDIVVDVGGQYDAKINRFDHHQREFGTTFPSRATKLSSAGLVFMHLGKDIIAEQTGEPADSEEVSLLHEKLYEDFIEAFDANDNGITAYDPKQLEEKQIAKKFNDRGFTIASVVDRFNRTPGVPINNEKSAAEKQSEEDARFEKACEFTGLQFTSELLDAYHAWLPARRIVKECFLARHQHDQRGRIIVLPHSDAGLPYHSHLYQLEEEEGCEGQVLYVVFPETSNEDLKCRVRAVSRGNDSFELRKPLPEAWRGVRDEELSAVTGIPGCVFVHASGFIGGNQTKQGALTMAKMALEMD